jgi:hypothetical protein
LKYKDLGLSFSETTSDFFPVLLKYLFTYFCFFSSVSTAVYLIASSSSEGVAGVSTVSGGWMFSASVSASDTIPGRYASFSLVTSISSLVGEISIVIGFSKIRPLLDCL